MMPVRMYKLEGPKGPQGVVLGFLLVGVGAVIVTAGLALLIVVALAGAALGTGVLLYRRLTGKPIFGLPRTEAAERLDPSLEVFAPDVGDARAVLPAPDEREQR